MKKQKEDTRFIQDNIYIDSGSKSIYRSLKTTFFIFSLFLLTSWIFYYEVTKYEAGERASLDVALWLLYDTVGKMGGVITIIGFGIFIIFLGVVDTLRRKNIKNN